MEHISKHLEKVEKATKEPINSLQVSKPISEPELEIIRIKYSGLQFGKMQQQNLWAFAKATVLKIHVITGWSIPKDDLMKILLDQFIKKIKESYPDTTLKNGNTLLEITEPP